jgi:anti-sigma B factor antagonist
MHVDVRKHEDVVIVDFEGRLAAGVGDEILFEVVNELLTEGYQKILLNLTEVEYIDSMGLGELVQSLRLAQRHNASLRLLKPQDRIRKTLHLTKLLPFFPIYDSEGEALSSFAEPASEGQSLA